MLNEIIKENKELINHPFIIPILKDIENFIPENARTNLYNNLKTLKVKMIENCEPNYEFKVNTIFIDTNTEKYLLGDGWSNREKQRESENIIIGELYHELIHMAGTNYNADLGLINSGFEAVIPKNEFNREVRVLNNYLNEGFTDLFTQILYPVSYKYSGYKDTVSIASILTILVGLDNIKHLYFTNGLAIRLKNIMTSFTKEQNINKLFSTLENANMAKLLSEYRKNPIYMALYYNNLSLALISLINIVVDGLKNSIQNCVFNSKEELTDYYNQYIKPNLEYLMINIKSCECENNYRKQINNIDLENLVENLSFGTSMKIKNNNSGFITILSLSIVFTTLIIGIISAIVFIKI